MSRNDPCDGDETATGRRERRAEKHMATFLLRASVPKVQDRVGDVLESAGFSMGKKYLDESKRIIVAKRAPGQEGIAIRVGLELEGREHTTLATAVFSPRLLARIALLVPTTAFVTITVLLGFSPDVFLKAVVTCFVSIITHILVRVFSATSPTPLAELPGSYAVLTGAVVSLPVLLSMISRLERKASAELSKAETSFWETVKKEFPARLVALAVARPLSSLYMGAFTTAMLVGLAMFLCAFHALILVGAMPLFVCMWVLMVLPYISENRGGLYPRAVAAIGSGRIVLLNTLVLLLVVLGFGATVTVRFVEQRGDSKGIWGPAELRKYLNANGPILDDVQSGDERMHQVQERASHWAEKVTEKVGWQDEGKHLSETTFIAIPALLLGVSLYMLFYLGHKLWGSASTSLHRGWQARMARPDADWIRLPVPIESRSLESTPFKVSIWLLFAAGAIINWISLAVSLDAFAFALSDQVLFFPPMRTFLSWVFVPFKGIALACGNANSTFWDGMARACIMAIAAPPIVLWARRIWGGGVRCALRAGATVWAVIRSSAIPKSLKDYVREVSYDHSLPAPKLRLLPKRAIHFELVAGLFGRRPTLYVSWGALRGLTGQELIAAAGHEVGHSRQRPARLRWLRILSSLGGWPSWFLVLPVDLRRLEEEADTFALRSGADREALAGAIFKASNPIRLRRRRERALLAPLWTRIPEKLRIRLAMWTKSIAVIDNFFFSNQLLASSHPTARDRIVSVLAWPSQSDGEPAASL